MRCVHYGTQYDKIFPSSLTSNLSSQLCVSGSPQTAYTGLVINPSGISDPCGTVAGMVTPKRSMSPEGETLQVSVLPYRCSIC